jgi:hypothetical protein
MKHFQPHKGEVVTRPSPPTVTDSTSSASLATTQNVVPSFLEHSIIAGSVCMIFLFTCHFPSLCVNKLFAVLDKAPLGRKLHAMTEV